MVTIWFFPGGWARAIRRTLSFNDSSAAVRSHSGTRTSKASRGPERGLRKTGLQRSWANAAPSKKNYGCAEVCGVGYSPYVHLAAKGDFFIHDACRNKYELYC